MAERIAPKGSKQTKCNDCGNYFTKHGESNKCPSCVSKYNYEYRNRPKNKKKMKKYQDAYRVKQKEIDGYGRYCKVE